MSFLNLLDKCGNCKHWKRKRGDEGTCSAVVVGGKKGNCKARIKVRLHDPYSSSADVELNTDQHFWCIMHERKG